MNKLVLIFIIGCILPYNLFGQKLNITNYVIFTFEWIKKGQDNQYYYWIIQVDSLSNKLEFNISPLYGEVFSQYNLDRCIQGDSIANFYNYEGLSENYYSENMNFIKINNDNKVKLQSILIKWYREKMRKKETVNLYATPMYGVFLNAYKFSGLVIMKSFRKKSPLDRVISLPQNRR